jgi:hypothetical protein
LPLSLGRGADDSADESVGDEVVSGVVSGVENSVSGRESESVLSGWNWTEGGGVSASDGSSSSEKCAGLGVASSGARGEASVEAPAGNEYCCTVNSGPPAFGPRNVDA